MTWDELVTAALEYFESHEDQFIWAIEGLDSNRGYLDDDRREYMDYLNEWLSDTSVKDIMDMALEGRDDDDGGSFNIDREYYYRDYWNGSLISTDVRDYSNYLDKTFIEYLYKEFRDWTERGWSYDEYDFPLPIQELFTQYYEQHDYKIEQ